jgi:hypothetical protein
LFEASPTLTKDDEYRRLAVEAVRQSRLAKTERDREAWLGIAEGWMSLVRERPRVLKLREANERVVSAKQLRQTKTAQS